MAATNAQLPLKGTTQLLPTREPIPGDFISEHWNVRPQQEPHRTFGAAQLPRVPLPAVPTPIQSRNLVWAMLPAQVAWCKFAHLAHRHCVPDARMSCAFRLRFDAAGLRAKQDTLSLALLQRAAAWKHAPALIDETDWERARGGCAKKKPTLTRPSLRRWAATPSRPDRAVGASGTRNTPSGSAGGSTR